MLGNRVISRAYGVGKRPGSITLIHDSNLFADVDDRQIAAAPERAAKKATEMNFQYICTFNSDKLPQSEFSKGFDIADYPDMIPIVDYLFGVRNGPCLLCRGELESTALWRS